VNILYSTITTRPTVTAKHRINTTISG